MNFPHALNRSPIASLGPLLRHAETQAGQCCEFRDKTQPASECAGSGVVPAVSADSCTVLRQRQRVSLTSG
jgi:hypothetical protein